MKEYVDSGIHTYAICKQTIGACLRQIVYDEYRVTEIVSQLPNRKRGYRKEKRNGKGQEISRAYYSNG